MYEHPQPQAQPPQQRPACAHTDENLYVQYFGRQGCHARCYACGTMVAYTASVREAEAKRRARLELDMEMRRQQHIVSRPLAAGEHTQGGVGRRWWSR